MEIYKQTHVEGYEVSNLGNVRSLDRYIDSGKGHKAFVLGKQLVFKDNGKGYKLVSMSLNNKEQKAYIHRLVAQAFIPNPDKKYSVNHINGVKSDNRVVNLEWASLKENYAHAIDTGLVKNVGGGMKVQQLTLEGEEVNNFKSVSEAARQTGVCRGSIAECVKPFRKGQGHSAGGFKWKYI